MSQEALANAAGISTVYLSTIERGKQNPSWWVIEAIAEALGVKVSELAARAECAADEMRE
ncbi:MAG: Helix-turn-helix domain [Solirubrobacterales bacterium]|jgi:transcriptional regulator with XRE-family HTH domain|nr:Helix-turn-helix domain [Solirubrobacterales bacterium]